MSENQMVIKIIRYGNGIFDFKDVPQGYVHLCCVGVPKPKGSRKFPQINGVLVSPTDEQVIDYAKYLMSRSDIFGQSSGKDPNNVKFIIETVINNG